MECAKCGEYFIGTCVSLKCYDILYNEKKDLEQENAKLKRDKKDQCIMYDDLHKKYTKVLERMTKAEAKLHNIEDGLRRLESFLYTGPDRSIEPINLAGVRNLALVNGYGEYNMSALTIAELINKLLIGGE